MSEYRPKLGMQNPARETMLSFLQGLLAKLIFPSSSNSKFQQLTGLSLGSAVEIRKVQSALRENWAASAKTSMRVHKEGAKRWANAARQSVSLRLQDKPAQERVAKASQPSQAPMLNEEILGLDDIFTEPVTGMLLEAPQPQPVLAEEGPGRPQATLNRQIPGADGNPCMGATFDSSHGPSSFEDVGEETDPSRYANCFDVSIRQQARQQGGKAPSRKRGPASVQHRSAAPPNKPIPEQTQRALTHHAPDPSDLAQELLTLAQNTPAHVLLQGLISRVDMLAAFGAKVSEALSIYPPPSGPVTEITTTFEPAQREAVTPKKNLPQERLAPPPLAPEAPFGIRLSDYDENVAADWVAMTDGMAEPHYLSCYSRSQESFDILMPGERRIPETQADSSRNSVPPAGNRPRLSIREQLQLDRDLQEDLSSMEYISRNNRIITDSLSNLVDQYFRNSELEDDTTYY